MSHKILALALVAVSAVALASCNPQSPTDTGSGMTAATGSMAATGAMSGTGR